MKRKTIRDENGVAHMKCNKMCADWHKCNPDECQSYIAIKRLAEYEDAEEQGLLLRLPCKVGDTVYVVASNYFNCQYECDLFDSDEFYKTWCKKYCPNGYEGIGVVEIKVTAVDVRESDVYIRTDKCGFRNIETVFLTKEEAEQALKQMGE